MLESFVSARIRVQLPFVPNEGQQHAIDAMSAFLCARQPRLCHILRGYAGTGKTSLVAAVVRALAGMNVPCVLLAPTGRAAKVMSRYSGIPAYTIHHAIYHGDPATGHFTLSDNVLRGAVVIVDEASMLSVERDNPTFGSGCITDDLVTWTMAGAGCRLLLVGDDAQLPPVGQSESRALDAEWMAGYGLTLSESVLTNVARQDRESYILVNATRIRAGETEPVYGPDFVQLEPQQVMESIERSYREAGEDETLILTRSNIRTNLFNQGIRARLLWREEQLENGDRIMLSANNYAEDAFLANGEMLEVKRLRNEREMYGFHFVDAELIGVDSPYEISRLVWLDTLVADSPQDSYRMQQELFARIAEDYPEIRNKRELRKKVMESPYYNALRIRYAYAVTCHKAQGGQWRHIYIDAPLRDPDSPTAMDDTEYARWLYTAVTRATERVYWIGDRL